MVGTRRPPQSSVHDLLLAVLAWVVVAHSFAAEPHPPAEPAKLHLSVHPQVTAPGSQVELVVAFEPAAGVKIARYPGVKVRVSARDGLIAENQLTAGDTKPPPPDQLDRNYFESLDPLRLKVQLDRRAPLGRHELEGDVTYYSCTDGLCSRNKVRVKFPVQVAGS